MSLIDPFNRTIKYLRVSVTDRCNLKCEYCMPKSGWHPEEDNENYLTFDEIAKIIDAFVKLGVHHVRLTGGEPLVRKNLPELTKQIFTQNPHIDLSLSTNAVLLQRQAQALFNNGIRRLNVSLDSLEADKFEHLTRGGDLKRVLKSLDLCKEIGYQPIKINCVVMKDVNDNEIPSMVEWALENQFELRFIELMPIGSSGIQQMDKHVSSDSIIHTIEQHFSDKLLPTITKQGAGPAKYFALKNHATGIGIISAVSQHFCETCNRVRITSRGELALCLGQEDSVDLRTPLREGASMEDLQQLIIKAIALKPERHFFNENKHTIKFREMSAIGG